MKKLSMVLLGWMVSFVVWAAPVNVNQASAEEIAEALKGVGPAKAEAIVTHREAHGDFKSIESLAQVKGVGEKTIEKNKMDIQLESDH